MLGQITANDLKVKGISAIDDLALENNGVIITVHGKEKYVVLSMEEYGQLREYELEAAIQESRRDIETEKYHKDTIKDHLARVADV